MELHPAARSPADTPDITEVNFRRALRRSGHPAYGITQLSADLERFAFLLGGSDGEPLFGHPPS